MDSCDLADERRRNKAGVGFFFFKVSYVSSTYKGQVEILKEATGR